jgi:hypothetical protein
MSGSINLTGCLGCTTSLCCIFGVLPACMTRVSVAHGFPESSKTALGGSARPASLVSSRIIINDTIKLPSGRRNDKFTLHHELHSTRSLRKLRDPFSLAFERAQLVHVAYARSWTYIYASCATSLQTSQPAEWFASTAYHASEWAMKLWGWLAICSHE